MQRDLSLIQRILEVVEEKCDGDKPIAITGYLEDIDDDLLRYHLRLCLTMKFIEIGRMQHNRNGIKALTWKGHGLSRSIKENKEIAAT